MADDTGRPGPPPVGSVAEEAARLLDALGGWASTHGYAAPDDARDPGAATDETTADGTSATSGADGADHGSGHASGHGSAQASGQCPHCGAANGAGTALTCQWCPVCQGLGLLRSVRPETVDRLADLAATLTVALRDIATHGRQGNAAGTGAGAGTARGGTERATGAATGNRAGRVQDITIEDEDQGSATV
ncbi:hypothetical protein [Phycicoccus sp. Soil748]|uniref:hypothetical protein n=1 Tax=Intrasporangiaceae TaxID=85021 RepID=UPI000702F3EC|nr:hypothetical protein [Phycicoccus sp. Soil748]KRE55529.1 hypothetical protein ASG70_09255 [Phycicoccus sp. Soil748]